MTAHTIILPYERASPVHMPRRDLVLASSDSLALRVTIVQSDDPASFGIDLTGGLGGPACRLLVWRVAPGGPWDYGMRNWCSAGGALGSFDGVISDAAGSFDIAIPVGTMNAWPRRCGWAVQLTWDSATDAQVLATGFLHVDPSSQRAVGATPVLTDEGGNILLA